MNRRKSREVFSYSDIDPRAIVLGVVVAVAMLVACIAITVDQQSAATACQEQGGTLVRSFNSRALVCIK